MSSIIDRYVELHPASAAAHRRALRVFPDGVTHDMRRQQPFPIYVESSAGSRKRDVDRHEIVDYVMGHGALLLGHGHPAIVQAVAAQAARGTHYGASHELEVRWGELVCRLVPSAERVRFTSSGTEATMMAVRLARAFTGRDLLVRLREHFHGWNDSVTGQPRLEGTTPESPGLPRAMLDTSIVLPQNDIFALERTLEAEGSNIAAMIFEATGAHWGEDPLDLEYVEQAREMTRAHGVVMIMDEVITGFRVAPAGAQSVYGVAPDLTTFAKILGGGLPGGAVAGRADLLDRISGEGAARVSHPGTYNANPLSAAAGAACLELVADGEAQARASATAAEIARGMNAAFSVASVPGCVYGQSSMLHIALGLEAAPPHGYTWGWSALPCQPPRVSPEAMQALHLGMLNEGVHLMGDGMMVSSSHTPEDVDRTFTAFQRTLAAMKEERLVG